MRSKTIKTFLSKMTLLLDLNLYSIITPLKFHAHVFENIMENKSICSFGANAPFSIIFSKVFKTSLKIFQHCLKIENDVMILKLPVE